MRSWATGRRPTAAGGCRATSRKAPLAAGREKLAKAAETAARQQEKIDAHAAEEQATASAVASSSRLTTLWPAAVANVTDPDSEIMKTRLGWLQGYNGQAVVTAGKIIVAAELTTQANGVQQLQPMLNQA